MKLFSIFKKNFRNVTRSWSSLVILFIIPLFLIFVSSFVLNSVDFDNLRIGVVNNPQLDFSGFSNVKDYQTLSNCFFDLTNSRVSVCINNFNSDEKEHLEIYLDNSNQIVSLYARQFILSELLNTQENLLEEDSSEINFQISTYSVALEEIKKDLLDSKEDLDSQEKTLIMYRESFEQARSDFADFSYIFGELIIELNSSEYGIGEYNSSLESTRDSFYQADLQINDSIKKTRENKEKIEGLVAGIDKTSLELDNLSKEIFSDKFSFEIKEVFNIPENPVLLAFPLLIALIITFTSLVLSNMFVIKEVNQASYFREIISPSKDISFLLADYFINLFFVAVQSLVLFLVGTALFSLPFSEISVFILSIFLTSSIFIFVGMSIGYLIKNQNLSMLVTISLVMVSLIFSDVLAISVLAGDVVKVFVNFNPFMILKGILENKFILSKEVGDFFISFARLGFFLIISFFITYFCRKLSKKSA
jgi:ABC-type transport system involved in multi-copper enzyme maturation permease subunit